MKLFWLILTGLCIVAAAFLALQGRLEAAFVIAALGIVSWSLNYRMQMKDVIAAGKVKETSNGDDSNEN